MAYFSLMIKFDIVSQFDVFNVITGTYDKKREFILTNSPSMDILISSNLERLVYKIAGADAKVDAALMGQLTSQGKYSITEEMKAQLGDFYGNYATEEECAAQIKKMYDAEGYIQFVFAEKTSD